MFSPHYLRARRRGDADPLQHCAMHVALYGDGGGRWAMTERWGGNVARYRDALSIGISALHWDGQAISFAIDEVTAPWPSRLRGTVRLHPEALVAHTEPLDAAGRHRWSPLAPRARVEVALTQPSLRWGGHGYLDSNAGDGPLEDAFRSWTWSRAALRHGAAILYDVVRRDGSTLDLALRVDAAGRVERFASPPRAALPDTMWRLSRSTRADAGSLVTVDRTLTDAPFYARSVLSSRLLGEAVTAMHESLSLDRFRAAWVQLMLPFRAPRALR